MQSQNSISRTRIADSLDNIGEYDDALLYRELALKEREHSESYKNYIKAKWHYTKSCILERLGGQENHKLALKHSLEAKELIKSYREGYKWFDHQIYNRIYHQYGYSQNWGNAHKYAVENYRIVSDTVSKYHAKLLLIIDDLGYINMKLGDHEQALKYYEKVLPLYLEYYPENKRDIGINFSRMAYSYRALGMLKEEFSVLKKAEEIWEKYPTKSLVNRFECFKNLSDWYLYYGDYNLSETYLNKRHALLDSLNDHQKTNEKLSGSRSKELGLYKNYIDNYLQKGEYDKVIEYANKYKATLKGSKREFIFDVEHEALLYKYQSQIPGISNDEAIDLLQKSIDLTSEYEVKFYQDPVIYQIELVNKFIEIGYLNEAKGLLESILDSKNEFSDHRLIYLYSNYAQLSFKTGDASKALKYFDKMLKLYSKNDQDIDLASAVVINALKPINSYESIDGILMAADFYYEEFEVDKIDTYLIKSRNLYFMASDVFNQLYLGERYNAKIFETYENIQQGLLKILTQQVSQPNILKTIEALESNSSRLTWSKFLFNKVRGNFNIPDSITNKESGLKTLITHYQKELFSKTKTTELSSDTLTFRISNLKLKLNNIQDYIRKNYSNYYHRSTHRFNLSAFKDRLKKGRVVVKYIFSKNNLYAFSVSKSTMDFSLISNDKTLKAKISSAIDNYSKFNSIYADCSEDLKSIFLPFIRESGASTLTIIPDGILSYMPFEILFYSHNSDVHNLGYIPISYSSSLLMLNEQIDISRDLQNAKIGVFSSSTLDNSLPSVTMEADNILNYFNGDNFENASKNSFMHSAKDYDILHLAMHSSINNDHPDFSYLEFTDDRFLMSELYNETLNAKLAVLSACETANGKYLDGEGVQSISRAFTYTGIPSTVVSLWKVDDEATSKIMTSFYKHLKDGYSKDMALLNAKTDYLANTKEDALKHPYYWAGFILSGNTAPLAKANSDITFLYFGMGTIGLVLVTFIFSNLKFRKQFFDLY